MFHKKYIFTLDRENELYFTSDDDDDDDEKRISCAQCGVSVIARGYPRFAHISPLPTTKDDIFYSSDEDERLLTTVKKSFLFLQMIQYKMIGPSTTATHLTCALCSFTSFSLKQFSHHLWTEHLVTIANYKCPYCLFITYTQRSLKLHFQSVHKCKKNKKWCHYFIN